tara:strand:+ start:190 stop:351 length:162 start_codon:yes stop_codon:yes gene_type:complete
MPPAAYPSVPAICPASAAAPPLVAALASFCFSSSFFGYIEFWGLGFLTIQSKT